MTNNPLRYIDPTGHRLVENEYGGGCSTSGYCGGSGNNSGSTSDSGGGGSGDDWDLRGCDDLGLGQSNCDSAISFLTNATIGLDNFGAIISLGEAALADLLILAAITLTIAQPETALSINLALAADVLIATLGGGLENTAGGLSLMTTAVTDILSGNSYISNNGLFVGKDTIISTRNAVLGVLPESNLDFVISASQLKYDMDRLNGIKPGSSINAADFNSMFDQVFWYDSPLQDIVDELSTWR